MDDERSRTIPLSISLAGDFSAYEGLFSQRFPSYKRFEPGETIQGFSSEGTEYYYYICSGEAAFMFYDENGTVLTLSLHGPGIIVPLYRASGGTPMEAVTAFVAAGEVATIVIPKAELFELMCQNPDLWQCMSDAWCKWANYTLFRLVSNESSVRKRLCSFLLLHVQSNSEVVYSQEELAKALATSRESVSRALSDLRSEGIVDVSRGRVKILSYDRLAHLSMYVTRQDS